MFSFSSTCEGVPAGATFDELRVHPVSAWAELNLGLDREEGKWVRTRAPKNLDQAAQKLADDSGATVDECRDFLRDG